MADTSKLSFSSDMSLCCYIYCCYYAYPPFSAAKSTELCNICSVILCMFNG